MRALFYGFCLLYVVGPLIAVPCFAFQFRSWVYLFGIAAAYLGSFCAAARSKLVILAGLVCVGLWLLSGFHVRDYVTFFYLCALYGYVIYQIADEYQGQSARTEWDDLLNRCDLKAVRVELERWHQEVNAQGEAEAGSFVFREDYVAAWEAFREIPSRANALALLKAAPPLAAYFDACCPGGLLHPE